MYNQTVSDLGLSMSLNGSMIGGGVCVDCQVLKLNYIAIIDNSVF